MRFQLALKLLSLVAAAHAFTVEEVVVPTTEDEMHQNIGTAAITGEYWLLDAFFPLIRFTCETHHRLHNDVDLTQIDVMLCSW